MVKTRKRRGRPRHPRKVSLPMGFNGDHGTGTAAAKAFTEVKPLTDENGNNPNRMAQRKRISVIERFKLEMRQEQAAKAIQEAYCRNEMLSSGGEMKERVQASPKPDATVAAQCDAMSRLEYVMRPLLRSERRIVEHICWHNLPAHILVKQGERRVHARFRQAMDRVADHLRF